MAGNENQDPLMRLKQEEEVTTSNVTPAGTGVPAPTTGRMKTLPSGATVRLKGAPPMTDETFAKTGDRNYTLGQRVSRFLAPLFIADPDAVSGAPRGSAIRENPYGDQGNLRYTPGETGGFQPKVQTDATPAGEQVANTDTPEPNRAQIAERMGYDPVGTRVEASSGVASREAPELDPRGRFKPLGLNDGDWFFSNRYNEAYGSIGSQLADFRSDYVDRQRLKLDRFDSQVQADKIAADTATERLKTVADASKPFARYTFEKLDALPGQPARFIVGDKVGGGSETRTADPIFDNPAEAVTTLGIDFKDGASAVTARQRLDSLLEAGELDEPQYQFLKENLAAKYQKMLEAQNTQ